jgi:lipopolysaccharide transport system permease protein
MSTIAYVLPWSTGGWRARVSYMRDVLLELVSRDLKIMYKRSSLGILWSMALPLFQFFVFSFLFSKVLSVTMPRYSAYAFSGLLIWAWTQGALSQGVRAITANRELIKRPGFPAAILPVVSVITPGVQFLWALPVLWLFLVVNRAPLNWTVVLVPFLMMLQFLLSLCLAYLLAALNVAFRDTQHMLVVILQALLFGTPIFYQSSAIPEKYRLIYTLNPLAHLIDAYRAVLMNGTLPDFGVLATLAVLGSVTLLLTSRLFVHMSYRFAEEL